MILLTGLGMSSQELTCIPSSFRDAESLSERFGRSHSELTPPKRSRSVTTAMRLILNQHPSTRETMQFS